MLDGTLFIVKCARCGIPGVNSPEFFFYEMACKIHDIKRPRSFRKTPWSFLKTP